jgi:Protein of unknown function (DUF3592)
VFSFGVGAFAIALAVLGALLVALGAYSFLQRCWLIAFGEHAVGTVVALVADEESPTPAEPVRALDLLPPMPHLRIAFTDYFGASHEVTSDISVSPKKFRPGDHVPVVFQRGHPETFFVNRFRMKWGVPLLFMGIGLALLGGPLAFLATYWPAFGQRAAHVIRQASPWLGPTFVFGLPTLVVLWGVYMFYERLRRLRQDYRARGRIMATGFVTEMTRDRTSPDDQLGRTSRIWQWIRVAYRDADGCEQTRTLSVSTGLVARRRREGQTVDLLVDRQAPQDILVNEAGELWFPPAMCVALGSIVLLVFTWAWVTEKLCF